MTNKIQQKIGLFIDNILMKLSTELYRKKEVIIKIDGEIFVRIENQRETDTVHFFYPDSSKIQEDYKKYVIDEDLQDE